ncbi:hypothetical protein IWZ01DRAFT_349526 [Phyllosticta capitalensis]
MSETKLLLCKDCSAWKPHDDFHIHRDWGYLDRRCRTCQADRDAKAQADDPAHPNPCVDCGGTFRRSHFWSEYAACHLSRCRACRTIQIDGPPRSDQAQGSLPMAEGDLQFCPDCRRMQPANLFYDARYFAKTCRPCRDVAAALAFLYCSSCKKHYPRGHFYGERRRLLRTCRDCMEKQKIYESREFSNTCAESGCKERAPPGGFRSERTGKLVRRCKKCLDKNWRRGEKNRREVKRLRAANGASKEKEPAPERPSPPKEDSLHLETGFQRCKNCKKWSRLSEFWSAAVGRYTVTCRKCLTSVSVSCKKAREERKKEKEKLPKKVSRRARAREKREARLAREALEREQDTPNEQETPDNPDPPATAGEDLPRFQCECGRIALLHEFWDAENTCYGVLCQSCRNRARAAAAMPEAFGRQTASR